mgnify:FL=1
MCSAEHKAYLKKVKLYKYAVRAVQVLIIVVFLIVWQLASQYGVINSFIYSSPSKIFDTIVSLYNDGSLFHHVWITFYEVIISFILGSLIGISIAVALWRFTFLSRVLDPYLTVLNSLPKVSLGPIIIIIAGAGIQSIIVMALFISVIVTIINVHQAFSNTDKNKLKVMESFKASKSQILFKLILPSNFNNIIGVFKVNIGLVFIGTIMGEFLVSKAGVGYLIMYGSQVFNLNLVMSGIIILAIMSSLLYYFIVFIQKRLTRR